MKALLFSLTAISLLASSAIAEDKNLIQAKHVSTTLTHDLPENLPFGDRPYNIIDGASLTFFFQAENIVSFDKESFFVEGWDKNFREQISHSGKSASVTIFNKKFKGIIEELEANGRVDVQVGSEPLTKKLKLKAGADPVEFPFFKLELNIDEGNNNFNRSGIAVEGKHKMIKSICILRDGKELTSNGSSSSNDNKTFLFRDIKDGDEIKVVYWSKLVTKTVKLYK